MSSERRYDQRRYVIEESTTQNNGARTVFIEWMTPGTAVPPHWHNRFSETFDLISGSMSVYSSTDPDLAVLDSKAQKLEIGKKVTVPPGVYHKYLVGEEDTVLRAIVTPGDADFERLLTVLTGLMGDGEMDTGMGNSPVLMAVVMGLADAHLIGPAGEMMAQTRRDHADEIEALRKKLLEKYDTKEGLEKLMAKS